MARLCDPDINMIILNGCTRPEPAIRDMIVHYYISHGLDRINAINATIELLDEHDDICKNSLYK